MTPSDDSSPVLSTDRALKEAARLQHEMETLAQRIRGLILSQPPIHLLGYVWSHFFVSRLKESERLEGQPIESDITRQFQHTLEYMHAVWSAEAGPYPSGKLDEAKAKELLVQCLKMADLAMMHAMVSSAASESREFGAESQTFEYHAKTTWLIIRGHRYQVLEQEFFEFVLAPHDDALNEAYGVDARAIARGIQAIADSMRTGYSDAVQKMHDGNKKCRALMAEKSISMEQAVTELRAQGADFDNAMADAWSNMFMGGICNLSKQTKLPALLLADMAHELGDEKDFFASGPFQGTLYRRLPARVRPLIKLGADYYATDAQFVRDSTYRAIQWGLLQRLPSYRNSWSVNQSKLVESSFPRILAHQTKGATFLEEVYFRDSATGEWVETDLVGMIDDVLLVVESKAGVMAMHSPATDYHVHARTIQNLVVDAYRQCRRFVEYLASAPEVPLFRKGDGRYEQVALLRKELFRVILPVGLTIESFTPFSSMCKALPEVQPLLGLHPFISMSVDDLFVLRRLLSSAGELFHYLEVRQAIAGIVPATIFDELDHLGAYVTKNRFDQNLRELLTKGDMVTAASFSDVIDGHFGQEDWQTRAVPRQVYPNPIQSLLDALDRIQSAGWLRIDAHLRNFGDEGRNNLAEQLHTLISSLRDHANRRFTVDAEPPLQFWVCRNGSAPSDSDLTKQGMISCLVFDTPSTSVICAEYENDHHISNVTCRTVLAPLVDRVDYADLKKEAERQKGRRIDLRQSATPKEDPL